MRIIKYILIIALALNSVSGRADDKPNPPPPTHAELAIFAMGLIGSVYKFGGDDPNTGMDCSGFVRYVYHEVAGVTLPHSAAAISKISIIIHKAQLKPGDLVFFKTMRKAFSHVGIYLGNNRFIHAASNKSGGVMISSLDDTYWAHTYDGARRLLTSTAHSEPGATATLVQTRYAYPAPTNAAALAP